MTKLTKKNDIDADCSICRWSNSCKKCEVIKGKKYDCDYVVPYSSNKILSNWLYLLKQKNIPTNVKYLSVICMKTPFASSDNICTSYESYVKFINDTLKQIRLGHSAVVFTEYQIKSLLRFEPTLEVQNYEHVLYIWIPELLEKNITFTTLN